MLAAGSAHAADEVLVLSTDETQPGGFPGIPDNLYAAVQAELVALQAADPAKYGAWTINDRRGALSSAANSIQPHLDAAKIVFIITVSIGAQPARTDELLSAIRTRKDLAAIHYLAPCCAGRATAADGIITKFLAALNGGIKPATWSAA